MKINFVSLGCDKNLVDSEKMLGLLRDAGYEFTDAPEEAEVIIINTCAFIGDAKEESIETILEMSQYKEAGKLQALVITGCLSQRYHTDIPQELPEVDGMLGIGSWDKIVQVVEDALEKKHPQCFDDNNRLPSCTSKRMVSTGGHYAYLKIAEGCNKRCTYCIIPQIRGNYRSVPMEQLLEEARYLADQGVKELILVAQETGCYGYDLYGEKMLPKLLEALSEISGIHWIRILYCYPEEVDDALIQAIKTLPKVVNYLDIPVQHCADAVLKRMGRATTAKELRTRIDHLREEIPDIALRTTMIVGFPGETWDDIDELYVFLENIGFNRLGVFEYSPEEGTPAVFMDGQISDREKVERRELIMEAQQRVAYFFANEAIGRELEVFIEGKVADEPVYIGRTYMDSPGVDGYIFIETEETLMSGDFVMARVIGSQEYDLIGELIR